MISALPALPAPLIGRDTEMAVLRAALESAARGHGSLHLLSGEPGIGKTRLAEEIASAARERGVTALWGRCYEGEGALPYWPWVEILRARFRDQDAESLTRMLGPRAAVLAQIVPEMLALPGAPETQPLDQGQARFRLFDAVTATLLAPGGGPLLLLLDDLHWADPPSLLLLEYLARNLASVSVVVVGLYRDAELRRGHPLARMLGALAGQPQVVRLSLAGLPVAEVGRLIEQFTRTRPAGELVRTVAGRTEGNPLFVRETVRLLAAEGRLGGDGRTDHGRIDLPPTVREVIGRRLDRLTEGCIGVLEVAAVLGRELDLLVLGAAAETAGDELLMAVEEAERANVIAAAPGSTSRYAFTHALMQEVLYEDLTVAQRIRLHRRAGLALEARAGGLPVPPVAELAHHFMQAAAAGESARAVTYARRAGEHAMRLLDFEDGVRFFAMALEALDLGIEPDTPLRCELLLALGEAQRLAGDMTAGQAAYQQVIGHTRALLGDGHTAGAALLARAALGMGGLTLRTQLADRSLQALLEEALAALGDDDAPLRSQVLGRLASDLPGNAEAARRDALSAESVAIARRLGDPRALAIALLGRHNAMRSPYGHELQLALAGEALQLADSCGDTELALYAYRMRVVDLTEMGDFAAFEEDRRAHERLARRTRDPHHLWLAALWRAMRPAMEGRFDEAYGLAQEALALGRQTDAALARLLHAHQLAAVRLEHGPAADAIAAIDAVAQEHPRIPGRWLILLGLYAADDRLQDARALYERVLRENRHRSAAVGDPPEPGGDFDGLTREGSWLLATAHLAQAAATLNDVPSAISLYGWLRPVAGRVVMASPGAACYGAVSYYLGLLATTISRAAPAADRDGAALPNWDDAERRLEDAFATHARIGARTWVARTRHAQAVVLLARVRSEQSGEGDAGSVSERIVRAQELLAHAGDTARELGMERLARDVEAALLDLAALRPAEVPAAAPRTRAIPDGLTAREVEILSLVAAGKSNRAIAAECVLSLRTVDRHIANIYRKIDAHSKAEATAYAFRHELV